MWTCPNSHLKKESQEWLHPETATWNSGGWRGTPQKQPLGTVGGEGHPRSSDLQQWAGGDTPHLLVCTPTETAHPGREDFTNHQLWRRTAGTDKRTELGEMFCLLAFISTFSEAFIHFYILFDKEWDMYFSNHCINGVTRFLLSNFIILKSQGC